MLQTHAYEVVFALPDGTMHKSVLQHTSTWHRTPEQVDALTNAVMELARRSKHKLGVEVISAHKIEGAPIELHAAVLESAFGDLAA